MITIKKNKDLTNLNGFKVPIVAKKYIEIKDKEDLKELKLKKEPFYILGKGFNTLFTSKTFKGTIVHINIKGIEVIKETQDYIYLKVGAGEDWPNLVTHCVNNNWGGIENLAYIPGSAGSAVVQNISAYGENFQDVFYQASVFDLNKKKEKIYTKKDCQFGYRSSVFKKEENKIIAQIVIKLKKHPQINTNYFEKGARNISIKEILEKDFKKPYTVKDIAQVVTQIRKSKLPEVNKIPSIGSFFLNPFISKEKYFELKKKIPNLQWYPATKRSIYTQKENYLVKHKKVKIAAGQLLDVAGWKGKWINNCGCYYKNASIVVTNKKATGKEVLQFTRILQKDIKNKFGIELKEEAILV